MAVPDTDNEETLEVALGVALEELEVITITLVIQGALP
jgi:hypothetical protein